MNRIDGITVVELIRVFLSIGGKREEGRGKREEGRGRRD